MIDFDPRASSADVVSYGQATGRDSAERSDAEHLTSHGRSTEVLPNRTKRRFSAKEKLHILSAADACTKRGELGALMRREGLYSSQIAKWRLLRDQGELGALSEKKRGRKPAGPLAVKLAASEKQIEKLTKKLAKAEMIISFQKKFLEMFGETPHPDAEEMKS